MGARRQNLAELKELQRLSASAIMRPLDADARMQPTWSDGRETAKVIEGFISPNSRLTPFERLEIYNRQYWFRLIDSMYEDFPGVKAVLGEERFGRVVEAYLERYPSRSYTMRDLGGRLEMFLGKRKDLAGKSGELAIEVARFEWAQIVGFDGAARPVLAVDELLGVSAEEMRVAVQPYITLLELNWPIDDWALAVKKATTRGEASNAVEERGKGKRRAVKLPRRKKVFVAVHRHENSLWYKRLEPEAFAMLTALRDGATLAEACAAVPERMIGDVQRWFSTWANLGWFCRRK